MEKTTLFSLLFDIILSHANSGKTQIELFEDIFCSYEGNSNRGEKGYAPANIKRWIKGGRMNDEMCRFYTSDEGKNTLVYDIEHHLIPDLDDWANTTKDIHKVVQEAPAISEQVKMDLEAHYSCGTPREASEYLAEIIHFSIKTSGKSASWRPSWEKNFYNCTTLKLCRDAGNRAVEEAELHLLLQKSGTVCLCGLKSSGRTELLSSYIERYHDCYKNLLCLSAGGKENQLLHEHLLRNNMKDSLVVLDGYPSSAEEESYLKRLADTGVKLLFLVEEEPEDQAHTVMRVEESKK